MKQPGSFFSADGAGFQFFSTASSLVILNLLWVLCCMPLITAGAATSALYAVIIQMIRGEDAYIAKSFFASMKQNLRQGTVLWLMLLAAAGILVFDLSFSSQAPLRGAQFLFILFAMLAVILALSAVYIFPIQAVFENSLKRTLKNALFMGIAFLPFSVLAAVLALGPFAVLFVFSEKIWTALFFDLVIGFAFFARVQAHIFVRLFQKYMQKES